MRVAVIGCGSFAQNHLNGWRDLESHLEMVKLAAAHGVAIILQKPLAPDWNEAREVLNVTRKAASGSRSTRVSASGIIFLGIDATWSAFVTGAVIIVAVVLDQLVKYHRLRRAAAQQFLER